MRLARRAHRVRVAGFRFAGVRAGFKERGSDVALIVADRPATAAGVFTLNRAPAAPVQVARRRLARGRLAAVLNEHSEVVQSAVIGRSVPGNEEVVAYVQLLPGSAVTPADLMAHAARLLTPYKRPSEIVMVDALPAASTGKILKYRLADAARAPVGSLPYGSRKLVDIARAIVSGPQLLLLDDGVAVLERAEGQLHFFHLELNQLFAGIFQADQQPRGVKAAHGHRSHYARDHQQLFSHAWSPARYYVLYFDRRDLPDRPGTCRRRP